ncbi:MAG: (d)CMP kinase [Saccharofermentanales bacterium]
MEHNHVLARLEALLFAAGDPVAIQDIADLLEVDVDRTRSLLEQLKRRYQRDPWSGLDVRIMDGAAALVTSKDVQSTIEAYYGDVRDVKLSNAAYETLAVIAYNAPATRTEVERVRGVNSDSVVSRLIERGLVEEVGTLDVPGRPALLDVTDRFLLDFGLESTRDLPAVDLMMYDTIAQFTHADGSSTRMPTPRPLVVAIDGPSGAGKSTVARMLSEHLGIHALDTGAMYRALGVKALRNDLDPSDAEAIQTMLTDTTMTIDLSDRVQKTIVDGEDMTPYIRTPEASEAASAISALPVCREYCVRIQRELGQRQALILEGRDIGTYVFPDAPVKFFITASPEKRAARRMKDLERAGVETTIEQVLADMDLRDRRDSGRTLAPTRRAEDAILIDTSMMGAKAVVDVMIDVIRQREQEQPAWRVR